MQMCDIYQEVCPFNRDRGLEGHRTEDQGPSDHARRAELSATELMISERLTSDTFLSPPWERLGEGDKFWTNLGNNCCNDPFLPVDHNPWVE